MGQPDSGLSPSQNSSYISFEMSNHRPERSREAHLVQSVSTTVAESPKSSQQIDSTHSANLFPSSSESLSYSSKATATAEERKPIASTPEVGKPTERSPFLFKYTNGLGTEFVPGRAQHTGMNSQSSGATFSTILRERAVRSAVPPPMDLRGSRTVVDHGVDTPPSSSPSNIREAISPSPNTSDFIVNDTINNNLPPTPVSVDGTITSKEQSNGLPPGVPTGPAVYRNRQNPPPNAPKGPASQRRRMPAPSVAEPSRQQRPSTLYPVSYSNSMTWKSTDAQQRETLEKMVKSTRRTDPEGVFELRRKFLDWKVAYERDRINRLEKEKRDRAEREASQRKQDQHAYHPIFLNPGSIWDDFDGTRKRAKAWPKPDCIHLPAPSSYIHSPADQDPFQGEVQWYVEYAILDEPTDENEHIEENQPRIPSGRYHCPRDICIDRPLPWFGPYNVLKIMETLELDIPTPENIKDLRDIEEDDVIHLMNEINEVNVDDIKLD